MSDNKDNKPDKKNIVTSSGMYNEGQITQSGGQFIAGTVQGDVVFNDANKDHDVHGLLNPYIGLKNFTYEERHFYVGRATLITNTVIQLTAFPKPRSLLFVTGASGSGKSSFVLAGLLPALEKFYKGLMQPLDSCMAEFRPSAEPLNGILNAMRALGLSYPNALPTTDQFLDALRSTPRSQINLLVIDQFEELFSQSDQSQAATLIEMLARLPDFKETHTHIIVTLRIDYLPQLFIYQPLFEQAKSGAELRAMTVGEIQAAIQHPLQLKPEQPGYNPAYQGKSFEPELVKRLAEDAAKDATYLPLLQVTLEELWKGGSLKLSAYHGLAQAIQARADSVLSNQLDREGNPIKPRPAEEQQQIVDLLLELVNVSPSNDPVPDVRRRRLRSELEQASLIRRKMIDELATARLLTTGNEQRGKQTVEVVDIIHETLLSRWEKLQEAIKSNRTLLRQRARLRQAVQDYVSSGKKRLITDGVELEQVRKLKDNNDIELREDENAKELVEKSIASKQLQDLEIARREVRDRTRRVIILGLSIGTAFLLLASLVAIWQWFNASEQRQLARGLQLAAEARNLSKERPDLAMLISLEALRINDSLESRSSLIDTLNTNPQLQVFLRGHTDGVYGLAFNSKGNLLASGSDDKTVILWDIFTQKPLVRLNGHSDKVRGVVFNPEGNILASASFDKTVILWNVTSQKPLVQLKGHSDSVLSVAFSPDGKLLASSSSDKSIIIWDVASQTPVERLYEKSNTDIIRSIAFSPDGKLLAATNTLDKTVVIWDLTTKQPKEDIFKHNSFVYGVSFSPNGKLLAVANADSTLTLWDLATQKQSIFPRDHNGNILAVTFSSDGKLLASASEDQSVILWDVASQTPVSQLKGHTNAVRGIAFSPDGNLLASSSNDNTVILWKTTPQRQLSQLKGHISNIYGVAISENGKYFASSSNDTTVILWDAITQKPIKQLKGHTDSVNKIAFSPDNQLLASSSNDKTVILWDVVSQGVLAQFDSTSGSIYGLSFSPDGAVLAAACEGKTVVLWDVASRKRLVQLNDFNGKVYDVAFDSSGKILATVGEDHDVLLWDWRNQKQIGQLKGHTDTILSVTFSKNGKLLASAGNDRSVIIWDLASQKQIIQLKGHTNTVRSVIFSPDSKILASSSDDTTIILWDVESQRLLTKFNGHASTVNSLAFSSDGKILISGSDDKTLNIWDVSFSSWQKKACQIANRNLTQAEWEIYLGVESYAKTCSNLPLDVARFANEFLQ